MTLAKASEPAYGIAKLMGEGYGKPDSKDEAPIDIQYAKIGEWLVRHFWSVVQHQLLSCLLLLIRYSSCHLNQSTGHGPPDSHNAETQNSTWPSWNYSRA